MVIDVYTGKADLAVRCQQLREALIGVATASKGGACWCDAARDVLKYGHQAKCARAASALATQEQA
jgi:hypothetical protein